MRNLVLILLMFSLLLAGCNANPQPTRGEVTVFVAVPLSGFQANGGQTVLGGVRLAAEEINRQGGLLGYKVVVIGLDDESDSDVALAGAEKVKEALASGQKVLGVVGHLESPDFQRLRVNAHMDFAPLATVIRAMLLSLPFPLAQHFDAGAIDQ